MANAYLGLGQSREAKAICDKAIAKKLDGRGIQWLIYKIALVENDTATMQRQLEWAKNKGEEQGVFFFQALRAASLGKLQQSHELFGQSRRAAEDAQDKQTASSISTQEAVIEAQFGYIGRARDKTAATTGVIRRADKNTAAITLALAGNAERAQALIDELQRHFPQDTHLNNVLAPSVRAAIEINRNNANHAIELLRPTIPFELGAEAGLLPVYLRGEAYLQMRAGKEAATEFQKIVDHPGVAPFSSICVLARPGLARAYSLQGDIAKSRTAYRDFFALWKDADPEIPILKKAKAEHAKLQ